MQTCLSSRARGTVRTGLTLIELVVVMVVLAAVAGIVLPLLPSMITRAHTSTSSTNIGEVAKAIQTHQVTYLGYPSNFDSLVTTTGAVATYVPGAASTDFVVIDATSEHAEALTEAGIATVAQMVESAGGDWNPTFYPYGADKTVSPKTAPIATPVAANMKLATLTPAAKRRLGLEPDTDTTYVLFGLGGYTTMQGKSLQEAPVHFADKATEGPNVSYARYGVLFQLTAGTRVLETATLALIVAFHGDGVVGLAEHIQEYHSATASN